jgi:metal transporter CNNM
MTVGYMGLDALELEVKSIHGTEEEKIAAARIMPLLANHHLLLATLLLGNAICFETLPIFMDAIMPSWMAILISTTFILVFGEVVPQALCVGPQQLQIASGATPLVKVIMYIFMPVTYFIAKALDWFLGTHGERRYNRDMLIGIVGLHASKSKLRSPVKGHAHDPNSPKEMGDLHGNHHGEAQEILTPAEAKIIQSTIELRDVSVEGVMIKLNEVFAVEGSEQITKALLFKIAKRGYSKVPIYRGQKSNIVGIIPTKKFVTADEYLNEPIDRSLTMVHPTFVAKDLNLLELLNVFQMGHTQTVFVTNRDNSDNSQQSPHKGFTFVNFGLIQLETKYEVIGMVTLKDLFERLCKIELKDHDEHLYSMVASFKPR